MRSAGESSGSIPAHNLRGVSAYMQFANILSEAISARHALQEVLAAVRFDNNSLKVIGDISSFLKEEIGRASERIQVPGSRLQDMNSSEPVIAMLLRARLSDAAFRQRNSINQLDESIKYQHLARLLIPDWDPAKSYHVNNLGNLYLARYDRHGGTSDIDKAIAYQTRAIQLLSEDPGIGVKLNKIADLQDRSSGRDRATTGFDAKPTKPALGSNPYELWYLLELADSHEARYEHLGELKDIGLMIGYYTQVVALAPGGHQARANYLHRLAQARRVRYRRVGEAEDEAKSIAFLTQAVELMADENPNKASYLGYLGDWCTHRFSQAEDPSDLERGISYLNRAVELTPDDNPSKAIHLGNLGIAYGTRVDSYGELARDDANKIVACLTWAVKLVPSDHPQRPRYLNALGTAYTNRFIFYGDLADVDQAISFRTQALQAFHVDSEDRAHYLDCLGRSYSTRFDRLGELSDIDQAIGYLTQAVELAAGQPWGGTNFSHVARVSALGNSHRGRFVRAAEPSDLDQAIQYQTRAVALTPDEHINKPTHLQTLGNSYKLRFDCFDELPDINNAIEHLTKAVALAADNYPYMPTFLSDLGVAYTGRFTSRGELPDIDQAIASQTRAIKLAPEGYTDNPGVFSCIGKSYWHRFLHRGDRADGENAHDFYQKAAELPVSDPRTQFRSAHHWFKIALRLGYEPRDAYKKGMELVPHLIWLGSPVHHRYDNLVDIGDFSLGGAAWAISVGKCDQAVEWLEEGRSIVWKQIIQLRTPFDDLSTSDPTLSQELQQVARELGDLGLQSTSTSTSSLVGNESDLEQKSQRRHQLARQWEELLAKARSTRELENFMRAPKVTELKRAARHSHVVLINVHSSRCDALAILPHDGNIVHVPLENFFAQSALEIREHLKFEIGHRGDRARGFKRRNPTPKQDDTFQSMLITLWTGVVEPVLHALGFTEVLPVNQLPYITWCTTGALSFLPLHAAGFYDGTRPNAMDLVISSYTPTLGALLDSHPRPLGPTSGLLTVGQEYTKGMEHLPNTVHELSAINKYANAIKLTQLEATAATVDSVLKAMEEHSWVHLACHATQNPDNPAHSTFHLHDGNLTLEAITKRSFKNKGLAFLSACQTAAGDEKRPDEAIHLAAGMLMAGYPSVIATMWSIYDEDGPEVAGRVYAELLKDGQLDRTEVARVLHKAVAGLREKVGEKAFMRWVPFIHIGS